jgi:hypothetical protein
MATHTFHHQKYGGAAVVAAFLVAAACGSPDAPAGPDITPGPVIVSTEPPPSADVPPPPTATSSPTTADDPIPAELVGRWQSTGEGNSELIYEFAADGGYKYAGVLVQKLPSGVFSFIVEAAGTAEADGDRLVLRPKRGKRTLNDPNSASGPKEQPIDRSPQRLSWEVAGGRLVMTDADGRTITYRRQ